MKPIGFTGISTLTAWPDFNVNHLSVSQPASQKDKNPIREISAWKVTDAIAAGYCFSACFLAGPLLNIKSLNCFTYKIKVLEITRKS